MIFDRQEKGNLVIFKNRPKGNLVIFDRRPEATFEKKHQKRLPRRFLKIAEVIYVYLNIDYLLLKKVIDVF